MQIKKHETKIKKKKNEQLKWKEQKQLTKVKKIWKKQESIYIFYKSN